jgi:hypothetical protein
MKIRSNLAGYIEKVFGVRIGLRGSFGRMPERKRYELRPDEIAQVQAAVRRASMAAPVKVEDDRILVDEVRARQFTGPMGPEIGARHVVFMGDAAWRNIARARGIDVASIQPDEEKGFPYFTAVPLPDDERGSGGILIRPVGPK